MHPLEPRSTLHVPINEYLSTPSRPPPLSRARIPKSKVVESGGTRNAIRSPLFTNSSTGPSTFLRPSFLNRANYRRFPASATISLRFLRGDAREITHTEQLVVYNSPELLQRDADPTSVSAFSVFSSKEEKEKRKKEGNKRTKRSFIRSGRNLFKPTPKV